MHKVSGGCQCGNIQVEIELSAAPGELHPRACDCSFCRKHGAAYVSDPKGSLLIRIKDAREKSTYRQGSGLAEFLLCRNCGVLVGVFHRDDQQLHATVNVKALECATAFAAEQTVSPQKLSADQKVQRWREVWFSRVEIRGDT
jgi:hypothetical protein